VLVGTLSTMEVVPGIVKLFEGRGVKFQLKAHLMRRCGPSAIKELARVGGVETCEQYGLKALEVPLQASCARRRFSFGRPPNGGGRVWGVI